jgi:hypothetical protein
MEYKKIRSLYLIFEDTDFIEFSITVDMEVAINNIYYMRHVVRDADNDLSVLEEERCKNVKIFIPKYYYKNKTFLIQEEFEEKIKDCDIFAIKLEYFDNYENYIRVPWNDSLDMCYNNFQKNIFEDDGIAIYIEER